MSAETKLAEENSLQIEQKDIYAGTREFFDYQLKQSNQWFEENVSSLDIPMDVLKMVPNTVAEEFRIVPISFNQDDNILKMVTCYSQGFKMQDRFEEILGKKVELIMTDEDNIRDAIQKYYGIIIGQKTVVHKGVGTNKAKTQELSEADLSPLVAKITKMIFTAINEKASDIHILPQVERSQIQFRIDGHLRDFSDRFQISSAQSSHVVGIIKNKCEPKMNSSNQVKPDDGSFKVPFGTSSVDIRVSTTPTVFGQKVVMRILSGSRSIPSLDKLGYLEKDLQVIRRALLATSGWFIATGPTGAGKTTTLYSQIFDVLNQYDEDQVVMTIENPVEYRDERFCQVEVHEAMAESASVSAREIFRAGLRQDPDIFLFGEIRDKDDAMVAIEAATTGHRVFSTVHARDCISAIDRLLDLDVSKGSLLREMQLIVSQRLVGLLCPKCSVPHDLQPGENMLLTDDEYAHLVSGKNLFKRQPAGKRGCPYCNDGFVGRIAIAEHVVFDMKLRDFLRVDRGFTEIHDMLKQIEFRSMWEKGLDLVREGKVELSEIVRAIGK